MFRPNESVDTKIAVLEEKFSIYETMMTKLESAIQTISQTSQSISRMLAIHEERIENCSRSDDIIIEMINQVKSESKKQHDDLGKVLTDRLSKVEVKVEEISKIKWMTVGCGVLLAILATAFSTLASGWWTPSEIQMQNQRHIHQQNVKD